MEKNIRRKRYSNTTVIESEQQQKKKKKSNYIAETFERKPVNEAQNT